MVEYDLVERRKDVADYNRAEIVDERVDTWNMRDVHDNQNNILEFLEEEFEDRK